MANIELRFPYCASVPGLLKWLAIIFSSVVLGLICWEAVKNTDSRYGDWREGEIYTIVVGFFTIGAELFLLLTFFFNCHNAVCTGCRCRAFATWIYLLCLCLWVAAAGVQVWVTTKIGNQYSYNNHDYNRRAASAAFCFANVLVFVASIHQARYVDL